MKYSLIIQRAALTARLLGYRVEAIRGVRLVENGYHWYINVKSPNGSNCLFMNDPMWQGDNITREPTEIELLGHWKVRLHMESQFGIKTSHYWE